VHLVQINPCATPLRPHYAPQAQIRGKRLAQLAVVLLFLLWVSEYSSADFRLETGIYGDVAMLLDMNGESIDLPIGHRLLMNLVTPCMVGYVSLPGSAAARQNACIRMLMSKHERSTPHTAQHTVEPIVCLANCPASTAAVSVFKDTILTGSTLIIFATVASYEVIRVYVGHTPKLVIAGNGLADT